MRVKYKNFDANVYGIKTYEIDVSRSCEWHTSMTLVVEYQYWVNKISIICLFHWINWNQIHKTKTQIFVIVFQIQHSLSTALELGKYKVRAEFEKQ